MDPLDFQYPDSSKCWSVTTALHLVALQEEGEVVRIVNKYLETVVWFGLVWFGLVWFVHVSISVNA